MSDFSFDVYLFKAALQHDVLHPMLGANYKMCKKGFGTSVSFRLHILRLNLDQNDFCQLTTFSTFKILHEGYVHELILFKKVEGQCKLY